MKHWFTREIFSKERYTTERLSKILAFLYAGTALGILNYWWQFHQGDLFPVVALAESIPNFQSYYLWKKSLLMSALLVAILMAYSALRLWFKTRSSLSICIASFCSGGALVLSWTEMIYGYNSGFYLIDHPYVDATFEASLSVLCVALVALLLIAVIVRQESFFTHLPQAVVPSE